MKTDKNTVQYKRPFPTIGERLDIGNVTLAQVYEADKQMCADMVEAVRKFLVTTNVLCTEATVKAEYTGDIEDDSAAVEVVVETKMEEGFENYLKSDEPELPVFNDKVAHGLIEKANNLFVDVSFKYAMQLPNGEVRLYSGIPMGPSTTVVNVGQFQEHPDGSDFSMYKYIG